ncbi:tetratricopeptide repeat protein [Chitinophaga skermanii]|uniref:Tetratricopeptide repeat protein n=1 Tax=Chitinophaga skermanii TaxID=331697 RepID=A0A327R5Q5_9BACT|nr:tetratricopeptide repeat protein [Chitinophaga skermanii]RAJ10923.1 tetratricopeptide repeat protein [Chitinophaga skermanii]
MAEQLNRAWFFIQHQRYQDAITTLQHFLGEYANNSDALYLLAICYMELEQTQKAASIVDAALANDAGDPRFHYMKSRVLIEERKYDQAFTFIENAVSIDPYDASYFATWSRIFLIKKKFKEAVAKAEEGLAIDPENESCLNLRSHALYYLNDKEAAFAGLHEALEHNPENVYTHTNLGWKHLENGDKAKALEHFREALRKDPTFEWARSGMAQAMKSKYWLYKLYLKYMFFMSKQTGKMQWIIIAGIFILGQVLSNVSDVLFYILATFVVGTWIVTPLSNLLLRINPYGRYLLTAQEKKTSNHIALLFGLSATTGLAYLALPTVAGLLGICIYAAIMVIPIATMNLPELPKNVRILRLFTAGLGAMALYAIGTAFFQNTIESFAFFFPMIGVFAYQSTANFLMMRENS